MIARGELLDLATDFGLAANVVEKDYALGWVLAALGRHAETRDTWLFKGGTCLKKCFFETYRFSEDLDFTLLDAAHLDDAFLATLFGEIAAWIYEQAGLTLPADARKIEIYTNTRGGRSAEGRIGYRGPLARGGDAPRIKLDLTADERIVRSAVRRPVHHPYSDRPGDGFEVSTYSFEELFAEKVRALAERLRPRDLYDVVHLYRHRELDPNRTTVIAALREKCDFKGIEIPSVESIRSSPLVPELRSAWDQMLRHQLPQLPPFEDFWNELPQVFAWLFAGEAPVSLPVLEVASAGALDRTWRAPRMATSWRSFGTSAPLEVVRFAAANHLCVELDYRDDSGRRSVRTIEPYSLRRSSAGNLLVFAVKRDTGQSRSYRVDRMIDARASQQSFAPRFVVELASGTLAAPPLGRRPRH
jgi:predicted nucleotidyltransferase component of viral defense system